MGTTVRPRWLKAVPDEEPKPEYEQPVEGQMALLPELAPPHALMSKHFEQWAVTGGRVSYVEYKLRTRAQCEECVWVVHERSGKGPTIIQASWRRRTLRGEQLLCHLHKHAWELRDGH